ncbi:MAG: DUF2461 domain-containing protein [Saprospiraceae bacterium]|nr:DUF2461 domain-containing protein [Saprospiraceae bacterium]MBK7812186.1 DUF2461 domain-containing protein [Saprospiraceae bacterium]
MLSPEFSSFLIQLEANNNRDWFAKNKAKFKDEVEPVFKSFIQSLLFEFSKIEPDYFNTLDEAVFRIYKDIRFSKDKTPYKTYMSAIPSSGGRKSMTKPGIYLEVQARKIDLYTGLYQPDPKTLLSIRKYIIENQKEFKTIVTDSEFLKYFGEILGEKSKVIPKEMKTAAETQPYLFNKAFYAISPIVDHANNMNKLKEEVLTRYKIAKPFILFLEEAIKIN